MEAADGARGRRPPLSLELELLLDMDILEEVEFVAAKGPVEEARGSFLVMSGEVRCILRRDSFMSFSLASRSAVRARCSSIF